MLADQHDFPTHAAFHPAPTEREELAVGPVSKLFPREGIANYRTLRDRRRSVTTARSTAPTTCF